MLFLLGKSNLGFSFTEKLVSIALIETGEAREETQEIEF